MTSALPRALGLLVLAVASALLVGPLTGTARAAGTCEVDSDCEPMQHCQDQICVVNDTCLQTSDCGEGQICYFGDCVASCGADSDCGPGQKCQDGACVASDTVSGGGRGAGCQLVSGRPDAASLLGALALLGLLVAARRPRRH